MKWLYVVDGLQIACAIYNLFTDNLTLGEMLILIMLIRIFYVIAERRKEDE